MQKQSVKNKLLAPWRYLTAMRDRDPSKRLPNPFRTWRQLMIGWIVFLIMVLIAAGYLARRLNQSVADSVAAGRAATAPVSQALLETAKSFIAARAARFNATADIPPVLIDPAR